MTAEKGGGLFQKFINYVSGRKAARHKAMRTIKLSNANQRRKNELKKKWFKTKKNKEELKRLSAKLGLTLNQNEINALQQEVRRTGSRKAREQLESLKYGTEPKYTAAKKEALEQRSAFQTFFNRFYKQQDVPKAQARYTTPVEGILQVMDDMRKPLQKENLRKSNETINEPPDPSERKERLVNGQLMSLTREPMYMGLNRIFAYLYYLAFHRDPQTPNKLNQEEYNELKARILEVEGEDETEEAIYRVAREVFHANVFNRDDLVDFDKKILQEEIGSEKGHKVVLAPNGKYYISETYGGALGRLLPFFRKEYKQLEYQLEYDLVQCMATPMILNEDGNMRRKPLSTLKSNACITLFKGLDGFDEIESTELIQNNWLALEPQYFPVMTFGSTSYKDISAKYFSKASFIEDALDNWGTLGMDSALFELFQAKYPEIAIKTSTYLIQASKDFAYQNRKLSFTENAIVIDEDFLNKEIDLTLLYPLSERSSFSQPLRNALQAQKVYAMSPYMAYITKKKSMDLWNIGFGSMNSEVYRSLNPYEKITIDYLQYLRFQDVLADSNFQFAKARETYEDVLAEQSIQRDLLNLYREDIAQHKKELLFFQSLVKRQFTEGQEPILIERPEDIQQLLTKFALGISRRARTQWIARKTLKNTNNLLRSRTTQLHKQKLNNREKELNTLYGELYNLKLQNAKLAKGTWLPWRRKTLKKQRNNLQYQIQNKERIIRQKQQVFNESRNAFHR